MPTKTRTIANCHAHAVQELQPFPRVSLPLDVTDEASFPNMAEASRYLASLSPERRAELLGEW